MNQDELNYELLNACSCNFYTKANEAILKGANNLNECMLVCLNNTHSIDRTIELIRLLILHGANNFEECFNLTNNEYLIRVFLKFKISKDSINLKAYHMFMLGKFNIFKLLVDHGTDCLEKCYKDSICMYIQDKAHMVRYMAAGILCKTPYDKLEERHKVIDKDWYNYMKQERFIIADRLGLCINALKIPNYDVNITNIIKGYVMFD